MVLEVLRCGAPSHQPLRLVVPLRLGHQLTGVADFHHVAPWSYTVDHLAAASLLGEQLGPLIELMFLYKQEEVARKRLASLIEISRAISHSLDLDRILPVMGRSLMEALDLPSCLIALCDEDGDRLLPRVVLGDDLMPPGYDRTKPLPHPGFSLDDPRAASLRALRVPTVVDIPPPLRDERLALGLPCPDRVLAVPLIVRDRLLGAAALPVRDDTRTFGEATLSLAMGIAQSAAWRSSTPRCTPAPARSGWSRSGTGWPARSTTRWPRGSRRSRWSLRRPSD